jgi:hypothetical protein
MWFLIKIACNHEGAAITAACKHNTPSHEGKMDSLSFVKAGNY